MNECKRETTKQEMIAEINRLIDENTVLKVKLEAAYSVEDTKKIENAKEYRIKELEGFCKDLQDQHQQDCIRINDLTTTIHVLSGLYSTLRKTVGMD